MTTTKSAQREKGKSLGISVIALSLTRLSTINKLTSFRLVLEENEVRIDLKTHAQYGHKSIELL